MTHPRTLLCALLALAALAGLTGCAVAVGDGGVPRCDRNGDEEQRIACTR